jgi:hypothetical protein
VALFTKRQRWIMDQVAKGIVRNDFGDTWTIMRKHAHGQPRAPSAAERNSLLAGRFVEIVNAEWARRVQVTEHGAWAMRTDDASKRGEV